MSQTDDSVARMLFVDVGVRSLLMGEARRRAVTRVVGIPAEGDDLSLHGPNRGSRRGRQPRGGS